MVGRALLCGLAALAVAGCPGGSPGGGGGVQVTGRVLSVSTGAAPNPQATVQIGSAVAQTGAGDGLFVLTVAVGSTSMTVTHAVFPVFIFTFPAVLGATDLGDFWIGPETVTIVGTVIDAATSDPVENALVVFAGARAVTNSAGGFTLTGVAYDSANEFIFFGIIGRVAHIDYVPGEFFANQNPVGGVITLPPILLAPLSDPFPPGPPFNLWGIVTLQGQSNAQGTIATLKQAGVPVRQFSVGTDSRYVFWAAPGEYTILFQANGFQDLEIPITGFTEPDQVIRNDVTLVP
ncbi:MAG: hypothetical protein IH851_02470 [Armatimonadetes bacterium]|nr:hypothetical protein [Armatimonadota bacterium]